ncbi:MAG: FAD-dependent oxidoreductase [Saprospiraceae bacterium]
MPTTWYEGKITKIESITENTKQFSVQILNEAIFEFKAGQFVTMDLPIGQKRLDKWRSYSLANEPNDKGILEFCIVRFEEGLASKYLCDEVKEGDILKFKGPDGGFVLPEDLNKPMIWIATGTGVAPFRGMMWDIIKNNLPFTSIHLIFGTRKKSDILYFDEFKTWAKENKNFTYSVALSRENVDGFTRGYVHEVYMDQNYAIPEEATIYLCGWSKMIDQAVELLIIQKKVKHAQIKYELYG